MPTKYPFVDVCTTLDCTELNEPLVIPEDFINQAHHVYIFGNINDLTDKDREFFADSKIVPVSSHTITGRDEDEVQSKLNEAAWKTIISAATERGIVVFDAQSNNEFTQGLLSLMQVQMRRLSGGYTTSLNRSTLTDLFMRKTAARVFHMEDTRTHIHLIDDEIWDEVENFYKDELKGSLAAGDKNMVLGLSLNKNDAFLNPVFTELEFDAETGLYRKHCGVLVVDNKAVILGSF